MTQMNDYLGKKFLAAVRSGDYAHAGEEESIQLLFKDVSKDENRRVLDMGCGRGGTAHYVQSHGWGKVTGIDIEDESVEEARSKYPDIDFQVCDVVEIGKKFESQFDLIYLFNVFYAFRENDRAMSNLRQVAKAGAKLLLFDYLAYKPELFPREMLSFSPPTSEEYAELFRKNNWRVDSELNLDGDYVRWYRAFLDRFSRPEIIREFPADYIQSSREKYEALLSAHETGVFGGRFYACTAVISDI